jgi:hypothetical protein
MVDSQCAFDHGDLVFNGFTAVTNVAGLQDEGVIPRI